jgi:hypothetical protein
MGLARIAHTLVFRVAEVCFNGSLPNDNAAIVASLLSVLPPETSADAVGEISPHLFGAVQAYKSMQYGTKYLM